ncbi:TetR/AcrR family transcriptional regulator [Bacillus testis]|uniref:TetR/AcrR family transcriptional regulator n=1 Tax=Bacillus testis TaxID=1622072 RepID=UPI00067EBD67|nr:TetR/AcrR family transcriptional regulator [Bacillus testis]
MPKIVDHEKRKEIIAQAMWRVISEKGMEGASVRNIAKEAGLSLGSLQHYFSTQNDLVLYALELVKQRITQRVETILKENLDPKQMFIEILMQLMPTDRETLMETQVWFEFIVYGRHKGEAFQIQQDGLLESLKMMFESLEAKGLLKEGLDLPLEIEKMYALIDGLALHAMLEPGRLSPSLLKSMIENAASPLFPD